MTDQTTANPILKVQYNKDGATYMTNTNKPLPKGKHFLAPVEGDTAPLASGWTLQKHKSGRDLIFHKEVYAPNAVVTKIEIKERFLKLKGAHKKNIKYNVDELVKSKQMQNKLRKLDPESTNMRPKWTQGPPKE